MTNHPGCSQATIPKTDREDSQTGYFLFSLDTELAWGHFDCFRPEMFSPDGNRERQAISGILDALDEFNISATWGLVGQLFNRRDRPQAPYPPANWLQPYPKFARMAASNSKLLYGSDVVETLLHRGDNHEMAFHGHTHRVFDEDAMDEAQARAELHAWLGAAQRYGIRPRTVIFPRNRIGHLNLFREFGFDCYRGEERFPKRYHSPVIGAAVRRLYYYLSALEVPPLYGSDVDGSGLVNLRSSYWLFGLNRKVEGMLDSSGLSNFRLRKLVQGVHAAAAEKKIIHLWAHPYEFRTPKDIEKLRYVFEHVAQEVKAGRIQSVGMGELAGRLRLPPPLAGDYRFAHSNDHPSPAN